MKLLLFVFGFSMSLGAISAQNSMVYANEENVAIEGYDVVAYFTDYQAVRGSKTFSTTHDGAIYYFVTQEHLDAFNANADKYLPQYGGYCAFALAKHNAKVPVDPTEFMINDGKLYLFFNDFYQGTPFNAIVPWVNNESAMKEMADSNWNKMN